MKKVEGGGGGGGGGGGEAVPRKKCPAWGENNALEDNNALRDIHS